MIVTRFQRFCLSALLLLPSLLWAGSVQPQLFTLTNGLRLIVKPVHRAPVVLSEICYRVGSSYEEDGHTGLAHALEHLMFKGTPHHPAGQFSKIVADNGGRDNAFTTRDFTCYFQELAADRLAISFDLEADRMRNLRFDKEAFGKEMQVVMEERRMRTDDDPESVLYEKLLHIAFNRFAYQHPTIGFMDDLQRLTVEDATTWYTRWYSPPNATLIVIGDVEPKQVYALAERYFGNIEPREVPKVKAVKDDNYNYQRSLRINIKSQVPYLFLAYNVPSLKTAAKPQEAYALELLAAVLNQGDSARLNKELVKKQQLASSIQVSYDLSTRLSGLFFIEAIPMTPSRLKALREAIEQELYKLQRAPISDEELERIKTQIIAQHVFQRDSLFYQAMEIASLDAADLSWEEAERYTDAIRAVTAAQIQEVAQRYFLPPRQTMAELQPLRDTLRK